MSIQTQHGAQATPIPRAVPRDGWNGCEQPPSLQAAGLKAAARSTYATSRLPQAVIIVAHASALVAAGLASTLRLMPDVDVRLWGEPAHAQHRGPHESPVHIIIGDAAQISDVLATAPWHAGGSSEPASRVVLVGHCDDDIDLRPTATLHVDAWLSVHCSADELFATVRQLCSRLTPSLPSAHGAVPVRGGLAPGALRRVREHIHQRLAERIELSELAEIAGLSDCHFARAFKQSIGVPPHRYLLQRRIEVAALLIESTDRPLSAIALDVGFSDQSHFTRMFSRLTKQTPREFRHQHR